MPYQWILPRGKPEKKAVFSLHCGDKTTINDNRAFLFINRKLEQSRSDCAGVRGAARPPDGVKGR